ncbi:MAG: hypothetical protein R3C68_06925 [Myxococcota bacterium]
MHSCAKLGSDALAATMQSSRNVGDSGAPHDGLDPHSFTDAVSVQARPEAIKKATADIGQESTGLEVSFRNDPHIVNGRMATTPGFKNCRNH